MGPWANYKDQLLVAKPNEEEQKEILEILSKRKKRRNRFAIKEEEEAKSQLHISDPYDYLGRSFLHIPQDLNKNLRSTEPLEKCFIPKKIIHTFSGHTKGIQKMQLFPVSGHLFLTCSMDCKVKVTFLRSYKNYILNTILFYFILFIQAVGVLQRASMCTHLQWSCTRCT